MQNYECKFHLFWLLLIFSLTACISPYDPDIKNHQPQLVCEGQITDQPGPYHVRITYSAAFNNDESVFGRYPENADVFIIDSDGAEEQLSYQGAGKYVTRRDGIRGIAGHVYTLKIVLQNGQIYESLPELLTSVPPIDTLYKEYRRFDEGFLRGEFDVFIDTKDPIESKNYYKWEFTHYMKDEYCFRSSAGGTMYVIPCCQDCWRVDSCYGCIYISDDKYVNGRNISRQLITTVPYDSKEPYFLLIKQMSLSENMYNFWKAANQIVLNSGGVFDKPPITVRGNIFNKSDPDEQVLGYFAASSVYSLPIFIRRDQIREIPFGHQHQFSISDGCRDCEESPVSTQLKPAGWDGAAYY